MEDPAFSSALGEMEVAAGDALFPTAPSPGWGLQYNLSVNPAGKEPSVKRRISGGAELGAASSEGDVVPVGRDTAVTVG